MKQQMSIFTAIIAFIVCSAFYAYKKGPELKNGDLIFITNQSGQGKAIQLATKSKYTHVGIVFIESGITYVYHAVEPVSKSTLIDFVSMSEDGTYTVKRLKDQSKLTTDKLNEMLMEATRNLGKHYDIGFSWSDEEMYCSEFVWKLFNHSLNLNIGDLKPLKTYDLSHPKVKQIMQKRYGSNIPYEEKMISPGEMYNSNLLEEVKPQ